MKSICLTTFSTPNREFLYNVTNFTKRKYCNAYSIPYIFEVLTDTSEFSHPAWYKFSHITKLLQQYDYVYWLDDDAGFVKFDVNIFDLLDYTVDINISKDISGLNTGSFLIAKSASNYFDEALALYDKYKTSDAFEQFALNDVICKHNNYKLIDGTIFNATKYATLENSRTNDSVILHLVGTMSKAHGNIDRIAHEFGVY